MEPHNLSHSSEPQPPMREQRENAPPIELLSVTELAHYCAEETNKFLNQNVSNDRFCLELFRRAIIKRDDFAWISIYQQYAPLVLTWVSHHQSAALILTQDGGAPLVNASFAKFSQALTPVKIDNFDSLAALLKYLKMCVHSVVADEVRVRQSHQYEDTLDSIEQEPASDDPADDVVAHLSAQDLWRVILEEVPADDERTLIYAAYVHGMKPSEISSQHPHIFATVDEVYRIKRNVLERLRRNRRLQALLSR